MGILGIVARFFISGGALALLFTWARSWEIPGVYALFARFPTLAWLLTIGVIALSWAQVLGILVLPLFLAIWAWRIFGFPLFVAGIAFAVWGVLTLRAWGSAGRGTVIRNGIRLNPTGGPFGFCRHPIYLGWFLAALGAEIMLGSALVILAIPGFFILRIIVRIEEEVLLELLGKDYRWYMRIVPRFGI